MKCIHCGENGTHHKKFCWKNPKRKQGKKGGKKDTKNSAETSNLAFDSASNSNGADHSDELECELCDSDLPIFGAENYLVGADDTEPWISFKLEDLEMVNSATCGLDSVGVIDPGCTRVFGGENKLVFNIKS